MSANNNFNSVMDSLLKGVDSVISTKTVVGEAKQIGDTIILPLVDVSFAVGAGAYNEEKKEKGAGGLGGKISPSAVLVIQNGKTRLVNIKNQDTITKLLDLIPDVMDRISDKKDGKVTEKDVDDLLNEADKK